MHRAPFWFALIALSIFTPAAATMAGDLTDGDFTSWTFGALGNGQHATVTRETINGNPGARLNITTDTAVSDAYGTAIKNDFSTSAALTGANLSLSLDVLSGAGAFGQGQQIFLLVQEGGTTLGRSLGNTSFPHNSFETVTFTSSFDASQFILLNGPGPVPADFPAGTSRQFGFAAFNHASGTLTQYYDNFNLSSSAIVVPEPTSAALLGLGALAITRRRRNPAR